MARCPAILASRAALSEGSGYVTHRGGRRLTSAIACATRRQTRPRVATDRSAQRPGTAPAQPVGRLRQRGGEPDPVREFGQQNRNATIKDMMRSVDLPSALSETGKSTSNRGPARDFWKMCDRFSGNRGLYVLYRRLSDSVHPSLRYPYLSPAR